MKKIKLLVSKMMTQFGFLLIEGGSKMAVCKQISQVNAVDVAKYILYYFKHRGEEISQLKLQKLIYYIDAWHNVFLERPLIRENFEAWMHGPVVREVWDYYRDESILNAPIESGHMEITLNISKEQMEVIGDVLDEYGDKTAYYLECLTHEETPWILARRGYAPSDRCTEKISKVVMKEYYSSKLNA